MAERLAKDLWRLEQKFFAAGGVLARPDCPMVRGVFRREELLLPN